MQAKGNSAFLPRFERNLSVGSQQFDGPYHLACKIGKVDLNDLGTCSISSVGNVHSNDEFAVSGDLLRRKLKVGNFERCV